MPEKTKKKDFDWIAFYLYTIKWVDLRINVSSYYNTYYLEKWIIWARMGALFISALIIIIGATLGAVIFVSKFIAVYAVCEIFIVYVTYKSSLIDVPIIRKVYELTKKEQLMLSSIITDEYIWYNSVMESYKAYLQREQMNEESK